MYLESIILLELTLYELVLPNDYIISVSYQYLHIIHVFGFILWIFLIQTLVKESSFTGNAVMHMSVMSYQEHYCETTKFLTLAIPWTKCL